MRWRRTESRQKIKRTAFLFMEENDQSHTLKLRYQSAPEEKKTAIVHVRAGLHG
jgi:hypothetical protein